MQTNTILVTFFLSDEKVVEETEQALSNDDWQFFCTGVKIWIAQTYTRLLQSGLNIKLTSKAPDSGIIIVHYDDLGALHRSLPKINNALIVCVRADRHETLYADIELLQNSRFANHSNRFFIPHWPQPNLIPRNPERKSLIKNLSFKGTATEINTLLTGEKFSRYLQDNQLSWISDTVSWEGTNKQYKTTWNDYSQVDLVVAMRKDTKDPYYNKPASKLVNAWLAGVPALLGPEYAYQELRKNELDYIDVASYSDLVKAIDKLINNPNLYQDMIENGLERAKSFTQANIDCKWKNLLVDTIIPNHFSIHQRMSRHLPLAIKWRWRKLKQRMSAP